MTQSARTRATREPSSMVTKVTAVMNVFDRAGVVLRLDEVAARTGLSRSSVHRILTQLRSTGMLQHGPGGYRVATSSLPVSRMVDHSQLRGAASPVLRRLHTDTSLVVHLGVLIGADILYLDKVASRSPISVPTRVAGRTPAHASALGKAMLAKLPAEDVDRLLAGPLRKCTAATISELPILHQELARIRSRHGLAYDDGELAVGLSSIGAPIALGDGELAGISLTGTLPAHRLTRVAPFLTRAARGIAEQLGSTTASDQGDTVTVTDDMLSRVLRTLSSDDWV
ncbi:IclR family transcriptional regulator [Mycobacterium sp. M26]|uniref:IclR family transcriptional regulator n=1 Tax=Mycobacterium sp. M26 TaxID=1762962 RepID=UPI000B334EA1|nr:IclR family transcriptional regulator [Mycobacterium sp. M26]